MAPSKSQSVLVTALLAAWCVAAPAAARNLGGGSAFSSRSGSVSRDAGRGTGGLGRSGSGPRDGRPTPGNDRTARDEGRRGPTDRPNWDGKTPKPNQRPGHGRGPGWWYRRTGYFWGGLGYGAGFYDPFYNPFNNYGAFDRNASQEDERNIEVRVKPDSAQVFVNGLLYSNSGKARFTLPSGPWTVEIRAPGYQTERVELSVEQGKRYRIDRTLLRDETFNRDGRPLRSEELVPRGR